MKINITVLENETFKTKLAATPADAYPDLFQSWGGATMGAQADAGLLQDITAAVAPWKDTVNPGAMSIYQYKGVQYGIPWDMGMIGFWYNKDLFQKAGITTPPTTWDDYLAAIPKLKAAWAWPRSRSRARTSGRRCTSGPISSSAAAVVRRSPR